MRHLLLAQKVAAVAAGSTTK